MFLTYWIRTLCKILHVKPWWILPKVDEFEADMIIDRTALEGQWEKMGLRRYPTCRFLREDDWLYHKIPQGFAGGYVWLMNILIVMLPTVLQCAVHVHGQNKERCESFVAGILAHESTHAQQAQRYGWIMLGLSYFPVFGLAFLVNSWLSFGAAWATALLGGPAWLGAIISWFIIGDIVFAAAMIYFIEKQYIHTWSEREAFRVQKRAEADPSWCQVAFIWFAPTATDRDIHSDLP